MRKASASAYTLLPASLPEMGSGSGCILEEILTQDPKCAEGLNMDTLNTDLEDSMDIDVDISNTNTNTNTNLSTNTNVNTFDAVSQSEKTNLEHNNPQSSCTHFLNEGTYMPIPISTLLDTLSTQPAATTNQHQPRRFTIYEDPEDMDIDGVGFFDPEPSWYLSPEDDKENAEGGENQALDDEGEDDTEQGLALARGRVHGDVQGRGSGQEEHSPEDHSFTEQERGTFVRSQDPNTTLGHDSSHGTGATANIPTRAGPAGHENPNADADADADGRPNTQTENETETPRRVPRTEPLVTPLPASTPPPSTRAHGHGQLRGIPDPITLGNQQALPSPSSLSATEISLRALPRQAQVPERSRGVGSDARAAVDSGPGRRRGARRVIRAANLV